MSKKYILVVDDEAPMRRVLEILLRGMGHKVGSAANGREALAYLREHPADLVLTDLRMPEMDGLSLLREIRRLDIDIPVILITAYGAVETAVDAMKEGAADFIIRITRDNPGEVTVVALGPLTNVARALQREPGLAGWTRELVVMGGAKISDKLPVIEHLLPKVDLMLIGGGMCFTLLAATGYSVGESLLEESMVDVVGALLDSEYGDKIVLPRDVVVADRFAADADTEIVGVSDIPKHGLGLDIGPETVAQFGEAIAGAESVFWNGPMGVFEWEKFRQGTAGVAEAVAACGGYTVVGGGDSVAAIRMLGKQDEVGHVSSGGGAGLKMLEGAVLPGIKVLERETYDA